MKAHYSEPLWGLVSQYIQCNCSESMVHFGYQICFLGHTINIFTKMMLCYIILIKIANFHYLY